MLQQSKIYLNEVIVLNSVNCIETYETRKLEAHLVINVWVQASLLYLIKIALLNFHSMGNQL
jgi:hypothetical protein